MSSTLLDYSVFDKLNFERKPIGVKFLPTKPDGMKRLEKQLNFCEMLKEAQESNPFYAGKGDFHCIEPMILGMIDPEPIFISGLFGENLNIFKETNAARKIYQYLPRMLKGSVNYVAFSPVDQLLFNPDVMVITADVAQARIILRSIAYSTGDYIASKTTHVATCAWIYLYPVLSGEMNYIITGLGAGMEVTKPLPAGLFLISVPWNLLPTMITNLPDLTSMKQTSTLSGGEAVRKHFKETGDKLRQAMALSD